MPRIASYHSRRWVAESCSSSRLREIRSPLFLAYQPSLFRREERKGGRLDPFRREFPIAAIATVVHQPAGDAPSPSFVSSAEGQPVHLPQGSSWISGAASFVGPGAEAEPRTTLISGSAAPAGRPPSRQLSREREAMDGSCSWWPSESPPVQQRCAALVDDAAAVLRLPLPAEGMPPAPDSTRLKWSFRRRRRSQQNPHTPQQKQPLPPHFHNASDRSVSSTQPMESLVGRLSQQTLETQDEDGWVDWKTPAPVSRDRMAELVQDQSGMVLDIDPDQSGSAETAMAVRRNLEALRMHRKCSRRDVRRTTRLGGVATNSTKPVQSPAMEGVPDTTNSPPVVDRSLPLKVMEPIVDVAFLELEADEGYCESNDDMSWLVNGGSMSGMLRSVRSNSLLKFRTSTEAALQCSQVVHKNPRMRKRRKNKLVTRLKTTDELASNSGEPHG